MPKTETTKKKRRPRYLFWISYLDGDYRYCSNERWMHETKDGWIYVHGDDVPHEVLVEAVEALGYGVLEFLKKDISSGNMDNE